MALMTILFTGLDASPWMCTVSVAGAVLDAGADDLVALQPADTSTTTAANTARREYQLLFGISRPSLATFNTHRSGHNTHRCLEIDWNDSWGLLGLLVDLEIEVHIAGVDVGDGDRHPVGLAAVFEVASQGRALVALQVVGAGDGVRLAADLLGELIAELAGDQVLVDRFHHVELDVVALYAGSSDIDVVVLAFDLHPAVELRADLALQSVRAGDRIRLVAPRVGHLGG